MCSPEYYTLSNFYVLVQQTQQLEASITSSISSVGARNPYHLRFFWSLLLTADQLLIVPFKHSLALTIINQAIFYQTTVVIQIQTQIKVRQFNFNIKFKHIEIWVYLLNQSHCILTKLNVNYQMNQISMYIILDAHLSSTQWLYHTSRLLSLKDNDHSSSF